MRNAEIFEAYTNGRTTLKAVGLQYGLSADRIRIIVAKQKRHIAEAANPTFYHGLSVRASTCIRNAGFKNIADVKAAFIAGQMDGTYNCGKKTMDEIRAFLGIETLPKPKAGTCPHCGKECAT